jgi:hypothetical protein
MIELLFSTYRFLLVVQELATEFFKKAGFRHPHHRQKNGQNSSDTFLPTARYLLQK